MVSEIYIHNSAHKEFIRSKWLEFINGTLIENEEFGIITFPAEEMHDLRLFAEHGLINWEENETNNYTITKGKVICFEKRTTIFSALQKKLVGAKVEPKEIGAFLRENYSKFMTGNNNHYFPVHAINLDYDENISKNKVSIDECASLIFGYQKIHKKNISFFITWPSTEDEDEIAYKDLLKQTIAGNINSNKIFKQKFNAMHEKLECLEYDQLSIVALSKIILKRASQNLFSLNKNEFYIYGEPGHHKMYSILLNFDYTGILGTEVDLYNRGVIHALDPVTNLQD